MMLHQSKRKIVAVAFYSRFVVIFIQFLSNLLIPDHDAGVFLYPTFDTSNFAGNNIIKLFLGGFLRWDAQYFMHIAKYGYTHENTLAFFPLYPFITKTLAIILSKVLFFLSEDSILLVTFVSFNIIIFVKAAVTLYDLTKIIINEDIAYKATLFFCINPATIFFMAPYTECLFAYLSFKCMLHCVCVYNEKFVKTEKLLNVTNIISIIIPLSLSTCTRSNGVLNIGFVAYFGFRYFINQCKLQISITNKIIAMLKCIMIHLVIILFGLVPFFLVQLYAYIQFCTNFEPNLSENIVEFLENNDFIAPGSVMRYNQSWCFNKIPLAYTYIQEKYWNVGFLKYYEIKQIPNFILAFPAVAFITISSIKFFTVHKEYCLKLGTLDVKTTFNKKRANAEAMFEKTMFVFVAHAIFLTMYCIFNIHIQVTTRMLCSASPVLYWFAAYYFVNIKTQSTLQKEFWLFMKYINKKQAFILSYFLLYCVVGIVMFSNFLPWT